MNNQMPMGYMPNYNNQFDQNDYRKLCDKVENLEKKVNKLEKKVQILENNNVYPMPYNNYNMPGFPNNYMM